MAKGEVLQVGQLDSLQAAVELPTEFQALQARQIHFLQRLVESVAKVQVLQAGQSHLPLAYFCSPPGQNEKRISSSEIDSL